ncbi:MAG: hypothetical protein QGH60_21800 [Phycisphaerae bacterium]|nr:hypothetical protein [Phycisphaerae bacterium]
MISFSCDNCGKKFKVSSDKGGKTAKCPGCGQMLRIPVDAAAPPPPVDTSPRGAQRYAHHHYRHRPGAKTRSSQAGRQRANMILLGVVLLIGFVMPIIQFNPFTQARRAEFINITVMAQENAPMQLKVLLLAPCVAGIGLMMLQGFTKHPVRGIVILFLAAIPILISMTNRQTAGVLNASQRFIPADAAFTMLVVFMGLFVAPVALLVGVRSRGYRPDSPVAYWFGVIGAGAWLAFLVIPVLPAETGYIFLMLPIKLIGQPNTGGISMGLLVMMVCTTISSVLCIINRPTSETRKARNQAGLAFWTLVVGFGIFMLCIAGQSVKNFPGFINSIKFLCWFLGMFMLFPAGITDLVVGRAHHHTHGNPQSPHPQTAPPDIPRRVV